jgi:hypothetical protein
MSEYAKSFTAAEVEQTVHKAYDALSEEERPALMALLHQAFREDVAGYAAKVQVTLKSR